MTHNCLYFVKETRRQLPGFVSIDVVNIKKIISMLGGVISSEPCDHESYSEKTGNYSFKVVLKTGLDIKNRRVRLAHELGHVKIHMLLGRSFWGELRIGFSSVNLGLREENEARIFALMLLMPRAKFLKVFRENFDDAQGIYNFELISDFFQVPVDFVKLRGTSLGIFEG